MSVHRYRIKVTQQDIDAGVRNSSAHCIFSTALGMQVPEATYISTDAQTIRFSLGKERLTFLTPPALQQYVIAFDAGDFEAIKPMDVVLANPMVQIRDKTNRASRLIVKSDQKPRGNLGPPSRTRAFGQRAFRVNQKVAKS